MLTSKMPRVAGEYRDKAHSIIPSLAIQVIKLLIILALSTAARSEDFAKSSAHAHSLLTKHIFVLPRALSVVNINHIYQYIYARDWRVYLCHFIIHL